MELLVVITIITLIMGIVGPRVLNYLTKSKAKAAKIQIESFASALDLFFLDTGRYPNGSEGLAALVQRPGNINSWNGPYLKGGVVPADPWGNPYLYRAPGSTGPTTFSLTVPTGQKEERPLGRTSRTGSAEAGFTLLELVCVIAIVAILAAIVIPALPRGTSRARLEAYAIEAAAMLKADRYAAIRNRTQIVTEVDAPLRIIRSGATGRVIRVPDDVAFDALLAARCNQRPSGPTIQFFASGMSCGGTIALTRLGVGYEIRVNWLTGGVEVVPAERL